MLCKRDTTLVTFAEGISMRTWRLILYTIFAFMLCVGYSLFFPGVTITGYIPLCWFLVFLLRSVLPVPASSARFVAT